MNSLKVAIVGGGPSGLFLAGLLKKNRPDFSVSVFEQNQPEDTFGFGVVLADTGLTKLEEADEELIASIKNHMVFSYQQTIKLNDDSITIKKAGKGGGAIERIKLLNLLKNNCLNLGVDLNFGYKIISNASNFIQEFKSFDVVVGADGVNSVVRAVFEKEFCTSHNFLTNHFSWFGTEKKFENPALVFRNYLGGNFIAHYYQYSSNMSTFVAECDHKTWELFDFEKLQPSEIKKLFENIFATELDGSVLIENNSVWRQFPVIRSKNWSFDKYVIIGDALASAHFSIGSGTRLAMEDSIALANSLCLNDSNPNKALNDFKQLRFDSKDRMIRASEQSFNWYENVGEKMPINNIYQFVYSFMTRTGRIDHGRLKEQFPDLFAELNRNQVALSL